MNKMRISQAGISLLTFIAMFIHSDDVSAAEAAKTLMKLTCKVEERITRTVNAQEENVDKRGWLELPTEGDQITFSMLEPRAGRKDYVLKIASDSPVLGAYFSPLLWTKHVMRFHGSVLQKREQGRVPFVRLTKNEIYIRSRDDVAELGFIRHSPWDWGGIITWNVGSETGVFSRSLAVVRCRESMMPWDRIFDSLLSKVPKK